MKLYLIWPSSLPINHNTNKSNLLKLLNNDSDEAEKYTLCNHNKTFRTNKQNFNSTV